MYARSEGKPSNIHGKVFKKGPKKFPALLEGTSPTLALTVTPHFAWSSRIRNVRQTCSHNRKFGPRKNLFSLCCLFIPCCGLYGSSGHEKAIDRPFPKIVTSIPSLTISTYQPARVEVNFYRPCDPWIGTMVFAETDFFSAVESTVIPSRFLGR